MTANKTSLVIQDAIYVFDIDGVLNNLSSYTPDDRVLDHVTALLERSVFVAINTGRHYEWVEENIVRSLRNKVNNTSSLNHLFIATEMGGIGIRFENGVEQKIYSSFSLDTDQIQMVRTIYEQHKDLASRMLWHEGKESMATMSRGNDIDRETYKIDQDSLASILQNTLDETHMRITKSNDAIDVHAPEASKWAGAQLIHDWLNEFSDKQYTHFICFGDSPIDYEMARYFAQQHSTVFVFTGPEFEHAEKDDTIKLIKTDQPYCEGTYQYLNTIFG